MKARTNFETIRKKVSKGLLKPLSTYTLIFLNLRDRKKWGEGLNIELLISLINKEKRRGNGKKKNIKKSAVYSAISNLNRADIGIYVSSDYSYVLLKDNQKKKEYRYFMPYDSNDREHVRDVLESRKFIATVKERSLHDFEETIEKEQEVRTMKAVLSEPEKEGGGLVG